MKYKIIQINLCDKSNDKVISEADICNPEIEIYLEAYGVITTRPKDWMSYFKLKYDGETLQLLSYSDEIYRMTKVHKSSKLYGELLDAINLYQVTQLSPL